MYFIMYFIIIYHLVLVENKIYSCLSQPYFSTII